MALKIHSMIIISTSNIMFGGCAQFSDTTLCQILDYIPHIYKNNLMKSIKYDDFHEEHGISPICHIKLIKPYKLWACFAMKNFISPTFLMAKSPNLQKKYSRSPDTLSQQSSPSDSPPRVLTKPIGKP